jgi:hypothetical protein
MRGLPPKKTLRRRPMLLYSVLNIVLCISKTPPLKAALLTDISMNMHNSKGHQNVTLYGIQLDLC